MSAERYEIFDDGALTIAIKLGENTQYVDELEDDFVVGAIRQQARDIKLLTQMLHEQRLVIDDLEHRRVKVCDENDQLRTDLAAAVAENAALLAANRDLQMHFDALKGDYDEAAHFARHFIRDDPNITPRGAIIRLGDKCTSLLVRLQQAEARLAAIDAQPVVAVIASDHGLLYIERALVAPTCVLRGSVPRNVCFVAADIVDHTDAPLIVAVNTQYLVVRGAYHKNSFRKFNIDKIDPLQIIWRMP